MRVQAERKRRQRYEGVKIPSVPQTCKCSVRVVVDRDKIEKLRLGRADYKSVIGLGISTCRKNQTLYTNQ